jgi:hypothetical protein
MKFILALIAALALCLSPALASNDNGNHYGHHKCDKRCKPHTHCVTNTVTVTKTNTVTVTRTNVVTVQVPVYFNVTNYFNETVTNYVTAALDDASANYTLQEGHLYRLYVAKNGRFAPWGRIAAASNQVVRISIPGALITTEPLVWQLVDVTKGFPTVAVTAEEPIATPNNAYVAVNRRLYRVVR